MERKLFNPGVLRKLFLLSVIVSGSLFSLGQSDQTRPYVTDVTPDNFSISLDAGANVSAVFSEAMNASTINSTTFELRTLLNNALVPATVVYNASTRKVTLYPSQGLSDGLLYVAKIKGGSAGVKDLAGNAMASDYTWYFLVIPLYDFTAPVVLSVSPSNGATGVSTGVTVSAVLSEEMRSSSINTSSVELRTAGNTLVPATVSYNNNTRTISLDPSVTLAANSLYKMTIKGGSSGVKDDSGNPLSSNYTWSFTTASPDITRPTVTAVSPLNGSTNVNINTTVSAVFSEAMNAATINTSTIVLKNNSTNALVTGSVSYNASTKTAVLTPSAVLAYGTGYTATVKSGTSGVKDLAGNTMLSNYSWTFTTQAPPDLVKPTIISVLPLNNATGVAVSSTVSAVFSENMNASTINTSTVQLRAGAVLISGTVTYNTSTRTVTLAPSAALQSSTLYTATVKGGTSGVKDLAGNAMASDYNWSFTTADIIPPTVIHVDPHNNATAIPVSTTIAAEFSEAMNASTISLSTVEVKKTSGPVVSGTIAYDAASKTFTFTPSLALAYSTSYIVTVKGGALGVKDMAGNAMTNDFTSTFATAAPPNSNVISIFDPTVMPDHPAHIDQPVEVGMRFRSSVDGQITGLRFYKGVGNVGTHTGHLWTNTGTLLGEVTFVQETASGWQEVLFASPITISANTTYVASYYSSAGIYAYTNNYFINPLVNGPLTALADGDDGPNGVYKYSPVSTFPTETFISTNYFVDVLFSEYIGPDVTPPLVVSVSPPNHSTGISLNTSVTAVFSEGLNISTINGATVELRNAASNSLIPSTVTYNSTMRSITLTPLSQLDYSTVYKPKIKGGTFGIKDLAGNPMASDYSWQFTTTDPPLLSPTEGAGGPILVISSTTNPFSRYAVEILRAEGLNEFAAADISAVTASMLNSYDVIVLGEMTVSAAQVTMLTNWVNNGGVLIAFKPSALLYPLCGISSPSGVLSDKYLLVNTASEPGTGIVNQTIQYHGTANLHTITVGSGAVPIATLYSSATTATAHPAVTLRNVSPTGGKAIAFTYDLAKSIIYTRQGNPEWVGQKRDGQIDPIRSDDLFFGGSSPDWIDFNKVAIPQADEQQRLLANIIIRGSLHRKPLPRFWYFPKNMKAAIVMTGDDHTSGGTPGRFDQYYNLLPGNNSPQDVADWKAIRGTSYVYPGTPITNSQAIAFEQQGFEIALHPNNGCVNYTLPSLQDAFTTQLADFSSFWPGIKPPATNRTHCLVWSDWASTPKVEQQNGIRFDVTYYYWPEVWMQNRPGMFTGSGMPMRFADLDGSLIDVYQAPTQMTDETNMNYTAFCNAVLDKATGPEGYYGVFTANMHTDNSTSVGSDAIIASAIAHNVPVVSARQMLTWLDGRNNSTFGNMVWENDQLSFSITARISARNLKTMLPLYAESGQLMYVTRDGTQIDFTVETIKGIQYAFFDATAGPHNYVATYGFAARVSTDENDQVNQKDKGQQTDERAPSMTGDGLYVKAMPNPSTAYFNIVINSYDATPVTVRVMDMTGRVIEIHQRIASTGILRLGHNWTAGNYFAEVIQGDQRKVIKIIKTN